MSFLFGGKSKPTPVAKMPDPEDAAYRNAEDRKRREIAARSGRRSTVLSQGATAGSAGTSAYKNTMLGQAS